jgi:hypothetical protein
MKKYLIIFFAVVLILLIVCLLIFSNASPQANSTQQNSSSSQPSFPAPASVSAETTQNQTQVKTSFTHAIQNANEIQLYNTVVVMPYALQTWGDQNKGGESLLKYDSTTGWILLSMGGGAWDVPSLVSAGVPQSVAEQLVAGEQ